MNEAVLKIIALIHILYILFIVLAPFSNSNYFLLLHVIIVPFMMLHWVINDNTCVLTIIEKNIRANLYGQESVNSEKCFMGRLIEPIYDFGNNYQSLSTAIYIVALGLWSISIYRLYSKYASGEIKTWEDLFKI